jgi:predicted dinucleotide-binding enzyme
MSRPATTPMRIGVLGTGMVGQAIAGKLLAVGHDVRMGSRSAASETLLKWVDAAGDHASGGTFADAAAYGELIFHCTNGSTAMAALSAAGEENLRGKTLIDVSNPVSGRTMPPLLDVCNDDSLAEQIQRAFPAARVVKTLNTLYCEVMVDPASVPGEHVIFTSGDDLEAKRQASELLGQFGWPRDRIVDLGDVTTARGTEMYIALYSRLFMRLGTGFFNISINSQS